MTAFELAESAWPRTGRDPRNSALVSFESARQGRVMHFKELPSGGAVVIDEHGRFLVSGDKQLHCLEADLTLEWTFSSPTKLSAALALKSGECIVSGVTSLYRISCTGEVAQKWDFEEHTDDSGPSPNLSSLGRALHSSMMGSVWEIAADEVRSIGVFGYDVLPPAVLPDGEIGVAGYGYRGPTLLDKHGSILWEKPDHESSDLLVTVNGRQELAFGCVNDDVTLILDKQGRQVAELPWAAVLSEHPDGWVGVSSELLFLCDRAGAVKWKRAAPVDRDWGLCQVAVDLEGNAFAPSRHGILTLNAAGETLFDLDLKGVPHNIALAPNQLVCVCERTLFVVE